ncbi:MAG: glutamate--tRNA ligase [Acidobacteriota bacterium]|nr:glutamate--tRNA ligase [Acidobacteriota bacterium]
MPDGKLSPSATPRVRFAPSPTGYLHVGGARTALFNWLFARHTGGTLILRIEDTDFERSSEAMVEGILDGMRWLGLTWDEGPFYQSKRLDLYKETAAKIVASGNAYPCFCTKEDLEQRRKEAAEAGRPLMYNRRCRRIPREVAEARVAAGEPAAIRFAVPVEGSTSFDDAVFGKVEFANAEIEDFVLLRSDGIPTYHLSVVADDIDMRLTHIIRGADHISNTPKQVLQYRALGAPLPVFVHVPLILGPDKTRLSKRHGATSVTAYKEMGIVPEAFRNFLSLLGWTPGGLKDENGKDREVFSSAELIALFSLEGISKSNAVFDNDKLAWFNAEYIRALPVDELSKMLEPVLSQAGLHATTEKLLAVTPLIRERIKTLNDAATVADFLFVDKLAPYDAADLIPQKGDAALAVRILGKTRDVLGQVDFTSTSMEQALREAATELGVKAGPMFQPIRVAVSGRKNAPPLFESMEVMGREVCLKRIGYAEERLKLLAAQEPALQDKGNES